MKLTPTQIKVLDALRDSNNVWDNWQTLKLSGRTQPAFDALVKKGLIRKNPSVATYQAIKLIVLHIEHIALHKD